MDKDTNKIMNIMREILSQLNEDQPIEHLTTYDIDFLKETLKMLQESLQEKNKIGFCVGISLFGSYIKRTMDMKGWISLKGKVSDLSLPPRGKSLFKEIESTYLQAVQNKILQRSLLAFPKAIKTSRS